MALVVSDASPIRCLVALNLLHLLHEEFGQVIIPPAVLRELTTPTSQLPAIARDALASLEVCTPSDIAMVSELNQTLDDGESEAIALAKELKATMLLIDESTGRRIAQSLGLTFTGTIGILVRARNNSQLAAVGPLLRTLRDAHRFWVSEQLLKQVEQDDPTS